MTDDIIDEEDFTRIYPPPQDRFPADALLLSESGFAVLFGADDGNFQMVSVRPTDLAAGRFRRADLAMYRLHTLPYAFNDPHVGFLPMPIPHLPGMESQLTDVAVHQIVSLLSSVHHDSLPGFYPPVPRGKGDHGTLRPDGLCLHAGPTAVSLTMNQSYPDPARFQGQTPEVYSAAFATVVAEIRVGRHVKRRTVPAGGGALSFLQGEFTGERAIREGDPNEWRETLARALAARRTVTAEWIGKHPYVASCLLPKDVLPLIRSLYPYEREMGKAILAKMSDPNVKIPSMDLPF